MCVANTCSRWRPPPPPRFPFFARRCRPVLHFLHLYRRDAPSSPRPCPKMLQLLGFVPISTRIAAPRKQALELPLSSLRRSSSDPRRPFAPMVAPIFQPRHVKTYPFKLEILERLWLNSIWIAAVLRKPGKAAEFRRSCHCGAQSDHV